MKIKIPKWCTILSEQRFESGNKTWNVLRLIDLSKELEVFKLPLSGLNLHNLHPNVRTMIDFVKHMKQVRSADLRYAIILDEDGYVMDGRHRIAKALLEGKESINAVRFSETPTPDGYVEEK